MVGDPANDEKSGAGPRPAEKLQSTLRVPLNPARKGVPTASGDVLFEAGDLKGLGRLPGVGPRLASQIVAELRGKAGPFALGGKAAAAAVESAMSQPQRDALELLVAWGDSRTEAQRWLERAGQLDMARSDAIINTQNKPHRDSIVYITLA